jgi:hypothetical protein
MIGKPEMEITSTDIARFISTNARRIKGVSDQLIMWIALCKNINNVYNQNSVRKHERHFMKSKPK